VFYRSPWHDICLFYIFLFVKLQPVCILIIMRTYFSIMTYCRNKNYLIERRRVTWEYMCVQHRLGRLKASSQRLAGSRVQSPASASYVRHSKVWPSRSPVFLTCLGVVRSWHKDHDGTKTKNSTRKCRLAID